MTAARLTLVRHGQAHCNIEGTIGGLHGCAGLTDQGRHQAHLLARRLAQEHAARPIHVAYTTPIRRVRETAEVIADELRIPIITADDLREPDYGDADGKPWIDVVSAFGHIPALHPDLPIASGAETWAAYIHRASTALHTILRRHAEQSTLIVGHGETVTAAAYLFLRLPLNAHATVAFAANHASITVWEQQPLSWTRPETGLRWALLRHNDTAHLE